MPFLEKRPEHRCESWSLDEKGPENKRLDISFLEVAVHNSKNVPPYDAVKPLANWGSSFGVVEGSGLLPLSCHCWRESVKAIEHNTRTGIDLGNSVVVDVQIA